MNENHSELDCSERRRLSKLLMALSQLLLTLQNVLVHIDVSRAERAKLRAEREIEEAHDKHLIDQERRAKIALQRAINRINVGKDYKKK